MFTLKELRDLKDEQIIAEHDRKAHGTTSVDIDYYLNELQRREQNRQTETIVKYTRRMLWLTVSVAILTAINVIAILTPLLCR